MMLYAIWSEEDNSGFEEWRPVSNRSSRTYHETTVVGYNSVNMTSYYVYRGNYMRAKLNGTYTHTENNVVYQTRG